MQPCLGWNRAVFELHGAAGWRVNPAAVWRVGAAKWRICVRRDVGESRRTSERRIEDKGALLVAAPVAFALLAWMGSVCIGVL